jgi:hypothetical protein
LSIIHIKELLDPRGDLILGPLVDLQSIADVFRHGHVGKQGIVLEADPRVPEIRGKVVDPLAVEDDIPRTDVGEAADQAQKGGFTASAGANEGDQFPFSHLQRDPFQDLVRPVELVDVTENQHWFFIGVHVHISGNPFFS